MRSIFFAVALNMILLSANAFAEYQYPGATWQKHTYDRSGLQTHNKQCDENGCLYTDRQEHHMQQTDQYYVPHSNAQRYYQPAPQVAAPRRGGVAPAIDYGPSGSYKDDKGNPISYAEFRRMNATYAAHYGLSIQTAPGVSTGTTRSERRAARRGW